MRIIFLLLLSLFCQPLSAQITGEVEDTSELALLPNYCRGTQLIRAISGDSKPLTEYVAIYGDTFMHLHHYCWALNGENKLSKIRDEGLKKSTLVSILGNIQYVVNLMPLDFSLLPDILISKARILFKMEQDVEAVGVLFKLTQLRPGYGPAYDELGDYYQHSGDKSNAIKSYEQGLLNSSAANKNFFIKKIKKLDKNYKAPNGEKKPVAEQVPPAPVMPEPAAASAVTSERAPIPPEKPNPYCRFCP